MVSAKSFLIVTLLLLVSAHARADEHAKFLSLLSRKTSPQISELKPFYRKPAETPLRVQAKFKERALITELGKKLFFEPRLSSGNNMACVTCHNPERGWTDGRARSVEATGRRSMSLYNLAWDKRFTWSGQAGSLMSQAILALGAKGGMSTHFEALPDKIGSDAAFRRLFAEAFSEIKSAAYLVSPDTIAVALEYYVSSIISGDAPFDAWIKGDGQAISEGAKRGFLLFNTKARCGFCHGSWRFSDGEIYDTGMNTAPASGKDNFKFKSVGLRQIAKRPPYMHDGSLATLEDVVQFYNRGGDVQRAGKSPNIKALGLTSEEALDLVEFLRTLSANGAR